MDKKYQVFISSTFTDMKEERQAAVMAILDAKHIPAGMELFAASDKKQIEVIRKWIDESDIFMLILGGRYGSVEPESGKSYTQLEYEHAIATDKPFFALYLSEDAINAKVKEHGIHVIELNDSAKLNAFRDAVKSRMCSQIDDLKDIQIQVAKSIRDLSIQHDLEGWVRASTVQDISQSDRGTNRTLQIGIVTRDNAPYRVDEFQSGHELSTVKIGISNLGRKTLSNCKVYVERFFPPLEAAGVDSLLLDNTGFMLRRGDPEKLVDIAAHWDHVDKFKFNTPPQGGFFDSSTYISDGESRTFTVRVSATEMERLARFEIRVDESRKLHLKFIEYIG